MLEVDTRARRKTESDMAKGGSTIKMEDSTMGSGKIIGCMDTESSTTIRVKSPTKDSGTWMSFMAMERSIMTAQYPCKHPSTIKISIYSMTTGSTTKVSSI